MFTLLEKSIGRVYTQCGDNSSFAKPMDMFQEDEYLECVDLQGGRAYTWQMVSPSYGKHILCNLSHDCTRKCTAKMLARVTSFHHRQGVEEARWRED